MGEVKSQELRNKWKKVLRASEIKSINCVRTVEDGLRTEIKYWRKKAIFENYVREGSVTSQDNIRLSLIHI